VTTFATIGVKSAVGLDFDSQGNLFLANAADFTIWKYAPNGSGVLFGTTSFTLTDAGPFGVAIDSHDNVFVAGFNAIDKFTPDGTRSYFVFGYGNVNNPRGLAMDSADNLYVANYGTSTIDRFDPSGNKTKLIYDVGRTNFNAGAQTVTLDNAGNIYVTNDLSVEDVAAVKKYTPNGAGSYTASYFANDPSLIYPRYMAWQEVPEPTVAGLLIGAGLLLGLRRPRPSAG
jgi:sugar lactone lactonase YvrE